MTTVRYEAIDSSTFADILRVFADSLDREDSQPVALNVESGVVFDPWPPPFTPIAILREAPTLTIELRLWNDHGELKWLYEAMQGRQ